MPPTYASLADIIIAYDAYSVNIFCATVDAKTQTDDCRETGKYCRFRGNRVVTVDLRVVLYSYISNGGEYEPDLTGI